MKEIKVMSKVKNRSNPCCMGTVVEKKNMRGEFFYRVLWDDKWETGDAKFYQESDIEPINRG